MGNPVSASSIALFRSQGNGGKVESQVFHDVFVRHRFGTSMSMSESASLGSRLLDGLEVQLGIRNVFNTKPRFDVSNGFTYYSWLGDPRMATYYLTLKHYF